MLVHIDLLQSLLDKITVSTDDCKKYDRAIDFACYISFVICIKVIAMFNKRVLCFLPQVLQEPRVQFLFLCPVFRQLKHASIFCICAIRAFGDNLLNSAHCQRLCDLLRKEQ